MSNAQTVQEIYEAFGRSDIPAILERVSPDVAWESWETERDTSIPWLQPRSGRDGVEAFFANVAQWQIRDFRVLDVIGDGRQVVVEVSMDATTPNGGDVRDEELHLWTFDDDGLVTRMRHYVNTAMHAAAARV
jgi:ketosteroid isomerase-like protein